jgi:hypothetical protein
MGVMSDGCLAEFKDDTPLTAAATKVLEGGHISYVWAIFNIVPRGNVGTKAVQS